MAETPRSVERTYLVPVPEGTSASDAQLASMEATNAHVLLTKNLQSTVDNDGLRREHARLSRELRQLEVMTSLNSFQREKALLSTEHELTVLEPPHFGCGKSMQHFACLRSKPRFTLFIKNEGGQKR